MQKMMALVLLMSILLLPIRLAYGNKAMQSLRYTPECTKYCAKLTGQVVARGAIACAYGCQLETPPYHAESNCHSQAKAGYFTAPHRHISTPQLTCICYAAYLFSRHDLITTRAKFAAEYNKCWDILPR